MGRLHKEEFVNDLNKLTLAAAAGQGDKKAFQQVKKISGEINRTQRAKPTKAAKSGVSIREKLPKDILDAR